MPESRKGASSSRGPTRPRPSGAARSSAGSANAPASRRRTYLIQGAALVVVAALTYLLLLRARGPGEISAEALAAADAAGCGQLEQPVEADPDRTHLGPAEAFDYADPPAAAGPHAPSPLPADPHVYAEPVSEPRAVHSLEHAYVLVYHDGLSPEAVTALEAFARDEDRVIMAPYPGLPEGAGLALLAWNTRWMCPSAVTADDAVAIAVGFVDAFRGTTVAPEAPRGLLGPLLGS